MRSIFFVLLFLVACDNEMSNRQNLVDSNSMEFQAGTRYLDSLFNSVAIKSNVSYGNAYNPYKNKTENLLLDVYRPGSDNATGRWVIVFVYGGGFWQGNKTIPINVAWCKTMAKTGFVIFAIEYRKLPQTQFFSDTTVRINSGTPLVGADTRAAVRFIRANANTYKIDPNKIVAMGTSSGGFGVMAATYDAALDSLNSSNQGYSGTPDLCIETSGGMPLATIDRIEAGENPCYLVHCTQDPIPFLPYALGCYNQAVSVGIDIEHWWIDGLCHGAIKCCRDEFYTRATEWIFTRFN